MSWAHTPSHKTLGLQENESGCLVPSCDLQELAWPSCPEHPYGQRGLIPREPDSKSARSFSDETGLSRAPTMRWALCRVNTTDKPRTLTREEHIQ